MPHSPKESLEQLRARVERLEKPSLTSPLFSRVGWPLLGVGLIIWLAALILPRSHFIAYLLGLIFVGSGLVAVVMSFISAHSEGVEETEHKRRIREKSVVARCLYLEGKVPDGKGTVGRCRLYEFDMVDYPYCLYCKEYAPSKGEPEV